VELVTPFPRTRSASTCVTMASRCGIVRWRAFSIDPSVLGPASHTLVQLHLVCDDNKPRCFAEAEQHAAWRAAMQSEMDAVETNHTWELADLPHGHRAITLKWLFKLKRDEDDTLVSCGFLQQERIHFAHSRGSHSLWTRRHHIAALHTQDAGLHNIRSLVSIVLDPAFSHYPRWRGQVLLILRRCGLADHVLDDIIAPPSPAWSLMDTVVLSWLHSTITVELQDIIRDQANTGHQAWLALEEQFLGNQDARALHLNAQFHQFSQGDLSVGEHCRQMKGLADSLLGLGEPVADRTLVLDLLCGLSPRYGHLKALIKRIVPFPTFHVVRNELLLEELTMTIEAPTPAPTLYSATPGAQASSGGQAPRTLLTGAPARPLPRPLVRIPPPTAAVAPTRANVGAASPPMEVPPAGATARASRRSTSPEPAPSPCGSSTRGGSTGQGHGQG
jgi:hypothetical protein